MCSLAMSFPFVYHPLLLCFVAIALPLFALYFAPGRGCFIAATMCLFTITTGMATTGVTCFGASATAMSYILKTTAVCAFTIVVIGMTINMVRTATAVTIEAIRSATQCLLAMTLLCTISALVRYAVSLDPMGTTCTCFAMGLLFCVPCMNHVPNQAIAGLLLCVCDILQYHSHIARAMSSSTLTIGSYISQRIVKAMRKFLTVRRMCQLLAILGAILLCIYIVLAMFCIAAADIIAYEHAPMVAMAILVIGAMCIWSSAILQGYIDLMPGLLTAIAAFGLTDYISIPTYPWLWAILISGQALYFAASMGTWDIVAIAWICVLVAPNMALLLLWVCVLVCAYTMACCLSAILLLYVYPWIVKKNYTLRRHKLAARLPCARMMAVGRGLYMKTPG